MTSSFRLRLGGCLVVATAILAPASGCILQVTDGSTNLDLPCFATRTDYKFPMDRKAELELGYTCSGVTTELGTEQMSAISEMKECANDDSADPNSCVTCKQIFLTGNPLLGDRAAKIWMKIPVGCCKPCPDNQERLKNGKCPAPLFKYNGEWQLIGKDTTVTRTWEASWNIDSSRSSDVGFVRGLDQHASRSVSVNAGVQLGGLSGGVTTNTDYSTSLSKSWSTNIASSMSVNGGGGSSYSCSDITNCEGDVYQWTISNQIMYNGQAAGTPSTLQQCFFTCVSYDDLQNGARAPACPPDRCGNKPCSCCVSNDWVDAIATAPAAVPPVCSEGDMCKTYRAMLNQGVITMTEYKKMCGAASGVAADALIGASFLKLDSAVDQVDFMQLGVAKEVAKGGGKKCDAAPSKIQKVWCCKQRRYLSCPKCKKFTKQCDSEGEGPDEGGSYDENEGPYETPDENEGTDEAPDLERERHMCGVMCKTPVREGYEVPSNCIEKYCPERAGSPASAPTKKPTEGGRQARNAATHGHFLRGRDISTLT